jgi:hypothetical protein
MYKNCKYSIDKDECLDDSDVVRNGMSGNNDSADVSRNDILNDVMERLDKLYGVEVEKLLLLLNRIYDMLEHPEKYKRFNKNCPKPVTMKLIRTLGLVREQKVERLLRDAFPEYQGYVVKHWNKEDEPDFIMYKNDEPFMVVEVKNYAEKSYMLEPEFQKIISRLCKYQCFKLLILSTGYNLIRKTSTKTNNNKTYTYYNTNIRKTSEELRSKGIYTWMLGYQDLMSMQQFNEIVTFSKRLKNKNESYLENKNVGYEIKGWMDIE